MPTDGWMHEQMWPIHAMKLLISFKKEGDSDTCYNMDEALKASLLSGISQSQRAKCCMVPLTGGPRIVEFREQAEGVRGWGFGEDAGVLWAQSLFRMMKMWQQWMELMVVTK